MEVMFETARLIVRKFRDTDAQALYENHMDEQVRKWFPNECYADPEEAQDAIRFYIDCVDSGHLPYVMGVELKETGELIGDTGFSETAGKPDETEIGYCIGQKYRNQGYATELVNAMPEFAASRFGIGVICGRVIRGNEASVKVLEKNGYLFETEEFGAEDDPYGKGMLVYRKALPEKNCRQNRSPDNLEKEIREVFSGYPDIICGFTDISYCSYKESYRSALVFAVPYGEQLTPEDYTEERFEQGIQTARSRLETVVAAVEQILQKRRVKYWIPPVAQENETELRALFSFKTAAAHAGIGWFGKNDVIITEKYGPRVRLSAILIDEVFEYGEPYTVGRCPESCTKCIDICPCKALKNRQWSVGMDRSDIIDYQKCNRMRSAFIKKLGRKNACGLCLAACPFGKTGE